MNRLSKEKRQQLILTVLVTATLLMGLWYGLIRMQQRSIEKIAARQVEMDKKLADMKATIARADQIEKDLESATLLVSRCEEEMASGDIYAWVITKVRTFKLPYKIEIPQFSQIDGPREVDLLPDFPYKQASLTVAGHGEFNEIGRFIADFENQHPFARVCNLVLEPANNNLVGNRQRLAFHMSIVSLVKPTL